jgi:DMSO/TMAO reductase YedYZ molybdopterin-dependent catalytic subunit|tara:strand:- start:622 stop:1251 length:630 start_codon:yes stop_codon:yes gene_type:complete
MGERSKDRPGVNYPTFREQFSLLNFSSNRKVPVISLFDMPKKLTKEKINISICGLNCKPRKLTWRNLRLIKTEKKRLPLICQIFNWGEFVKWEGWKLKDILDKYNLAGKENRYFTFSSRDGEYFESLSWEEAMDDRTMIVFKMDGKELSNEHGGPLRLIVPRVQGFKSVKWLDGIRSFREDPKGIKFLLRQSLNHKLSKEIKKKYKIIE